MKEGEQRQKERSMHAEECMQERSKLESKQDIEWRNKAGKKRERN